MRMSDDATDTTNPTAASTVRPEDEVARICADLIRIDSTNYGDGSGPGEREAAEYVLGQLAEVGLDAQLFESEKGRATVVLRLEGEDATRPGLAVHGHLDVVPANAADWQVDPFGAEERDGCIWGRGAVDMKDMDAMILANVRDFARTGTKPARDTTVVFFADEEAGGRLGSHWLVDHHPELFEGVTEAISEVGGYSVTLPTPEGERPGLPAPDRGEGHRLAPAAGPRPGRPRLGAQRRQRDRPPRRRRRADRRARVAAGVHRVGQPAARRS